MQWYVAVVDKDITEFTPQLEEVEQVAWVSGDRLLRELNETPEKYIGAMKEIAALFR